jgi:hypothetical protein
MLRPRPGRSGPKLSSGPPSPVGRGLERLRAVRRSDLRERVRVGPHRKRTTLTLWLLRAALRVGWRIATLCEPQALSPWERVRTCSVEPFSWRPNHPQTQAPPDRAALRRAPVRTSLTMPPSRREEGRKALRSCCGGSVWSGMAPSISYPSGCAAGPQRSGSGRPPRSGDGAARAPALPPRASGKGLRPPLVRGNTSCDAFGKPCARSVRLSPKRYSLSKIRAKARTLRRPFHTFSERSREAADARLFSYPVILGPVPRMTVGANH